MSKTEVDEWLQEITRKALTKASDPVYQARVDAVFELVKPKPPKNWKGVINAKLKVGDVERVIKSEPLPEREVFKWITDAVVHFTGSIPEITTQGQTIRVRAAGYHNAIGM